MSRCTMPERKEVMKKKTEKLTLESFLEKLKSSGYLNALTAKRALGKAQGLSGVDRDRARSAIDKHYGVSSTAPAKKAAKPAKKAEPKRAAKPAKKATTQRGHTKSGSRPVAQTSDLVRIFKETGSDSDYTLIQPAAKAPLTYDLHQKMSLTVQSISSASSGLDTLLRVQTALKDDTLQPNEFQGMLATGARVIHKANLLGHRNLDAVLGEEKVADIVGPPEAGIDRPRRPAPKLPPKTSGPDGKAMRVADPGIKFVPARVPVSERGIGERTEYTSGSAEEDSDDPAEEPVNSDGRELFRNSHPARGV